MGISNPTTAAWIRCLLGCVFFYLGLKNAFANEQVASFAASSLLAIPFSVWLASVATNSMQSMIEDSAINYRDSWQQFKGPGGWHLLLYLMAVLFVTCGASFLKLKFFADPRSSIPAWTYTLLAATTSIIQGATAASWILSSALVARWSLKYEKDVGVKLFERIK